MSPTMELCLIPYAQIEKGPIGPLPFPQHIRV